MYCRSREVGFEKPRGCLWAWRFTKITWDSNYLQAKQGFKTNNQDVRTYCLYTSSEIDQRNLKCLRSEAAQKQNHKLVKLFLSMTWRKLSFQKFKEGRKERLSLGAEGSRSEKEINGSGAQRTGMSPSITQGLLARDLEEILG